MAQGKEDQTGILNKIILARIKFNRTFGLKRFQT